MGIFDSLRKITGNKQEESSSWNQPQTEDAVDEILRNENKPQVIYKHSYRCGISMVARNSLDSGIHSLFEQADFYLVDVVANRFLSKYISEKTGVCHESPQIIVMHKGNPFWQASHGGVRIDALKQALKDLSVYSNR